MSDRTMYDRNQGNGYQLAIADETATACVVGMAEDATNSLATTIFACIVDVLWTKMLETVGHCDQISIETNALGVRRQAATPEDIALHHAL